MQAPPLTWRETKPMLPLGMWPLPHAIQRPSGAWKIISCEEGNFPRAFRQKAPFFLPFRPVLPPAFLHRLLFGVLNTIPLPGKKPEWHKCMACGALPPVHRHMSDSQMACYYVAVLLRSVADSFDTWQCHYVTLWGVCLLQIQQILLQSIIATLEPSA